MSQNIQINDGTLPVSVQRLSDNRVLVLGKSANFSGIIKNVTSITQLSDQGMSASTDQVYHTVNDLLNNISNVVVTVACIPKSDTGTTITDVPFAGDKNGSNTDFSVPYSPITSMSNIEVKIDNTGNVPDNAIDLGYDKESFTGQWIDTTAGIGPVVVNGIYNGSVEVSGTSYITISGTMGQISGYLPGAGDQIRADITKETLGDVIAELSRPDYRFKMFCFSYPSITEGSAKSFTGDFRHGTGYCVRGSWLDDLKFGRMLASRFNNSEGRYTQFSFSMPDSVAPSDTIDAKFISGVSDISGQTYIDYMSSISNKYCIWSRAKQHSSMATSFSAMALGDPTDPAVMMINTCMNDASTRLPKIYASPLGNVSQTDHPKDAEVRAWNDANVNVIGVTEANTTASVWLGNWTAGASWPETTINFQLTRNDFKYDVKVALWQLLYTRQVPFSIDGAVKVKDTILGIARDYQDQGLFDEGTITVTVPDLARLQNEDSLSDEESATLALNRADGKFKGVSIQVPWKGDVIAITIDAVVNS